MFPHRHPPLSVTLRTSCVRRDWERRILTTRVQRLQWWVGHTHTHTLFHVLHVFLTQIEEESSSLTPYKNDLEYLDDHFQVTFLLPSIFCGLQESNMNWTKGYTALSRFGSCLWEAITFVWNVLKTKTCWQTFGMNQCSQWVEMPHQIRQNQG